MLASTKAFIGLLGMIPVITSVIEGPSFFTNSFMLAMSPLKPGLIILLIIKARLIAIHVVKRYKNNDLPPILPSEVILFKFDTPQTIEKNTTGTTSIFREEINKPAGISIKFRIKALFCKSRKFKKDPIIDPKINARNILFVSDIKYNIIFIDMMHLKFLKMIFKLFLLIIFIFANVSAADKEIVIDTLGNKIIFNVKVAETRKEREKGLMYKEELKSNSGMLFVFPNSQIVNIWMRNTLIPLDIIYISEESNITQIVRDALPKNKTIYSSKEFTKYVLEINAGQAMKHNIKVGNKVYIGK